MSLPNTHYGEAEIGRILSGVDCLFFDGIGGVSMQSLAIIAKRRGYTVKGYDREKTTATEMLKRSGIDVYYEEEAGQLEGVGALIYTVAIRADNAQYAEAMRRGLPCISRADFLGYIMSRYTARIGVAGMHGKSTTTAMLDSIFALARRDPTVTCGAVMKSTGSTYRIGGGDDFIFEACEYMDSFLDFLPTTALVLNIEMEHVDYFKSLEQIEASFSEFMSKCGDKGSAVVNLGDSSVIRAAEKSGVPLVTFGVELPEADYNATNISIDSGYASFDIYFHGERIATPHMRLPGAHFVTDAVAAAACAHHHGISGVDIEKALSLYDGIARRMEHKGEAASGADIYSDYAHHPTELAVTLKGLSSVCRGKLIVVFQPHTYSRCARLFADFTKALSESGADEFVIADIYSARETDDCGVSSERLAQAVSGAEKKCCSISDFREIARYVNSVSTKGDIIALLGAGDIDSLCALL